MADRFNKISKVVLEAKAFKYSYRGFFPEYLLDEVQKSLTPAVDAIDYCVQLLSKKPESHIAMLENLKKKTGACGYLWMEAEICAMLAELGKDVTINKNRSTRIHKECGTTTAACFFCYSCRYQTLKIINQKSQDNDNNKSLTPRITVNCYGN